MVTTIYKSSTLPLRTPVLDYPTLGGVAASWMESSLVFGPGDRQGEPYQVDPFLREFLDDLYRVHPTSGRRVVRRAVLSVAKGNAKSEIESAIDLFELDGPCTVDPATGRAVRRKSPDIPCAAASYDQADIVFGTARIMCEPIAARLDVYDKEISRRDGTGRMYRVAAAAGTNDGRRPTSVSIDELHEWVDNKERVYLILTNGLAKRSDSFELSVSTAGNPGVSHLLFNLYDYGRKVAAGEIVDESFLMHWYEAPKDVNLDDHGELLEALAAANPGSWIDLERIAKRYEVDRIPAHEMRRYHLNQWVTGGTSWLPAGDWDACEDSSIVVADGARVVLTFDGSYNGDSTVIVGTTLDGDTPHVFEVGAWEKPEGVKDWKVDREAVDAAMDQAFARFNVVELAADPARWGLYMDQWAVRYGEDRVLEYSQKRQMMVPATSKTYDAVTQGLLTHDGSAVLRRHVGNASVKEIPDGRYVLQKDHPERKIDGAICVVMGFDRATWRREQPSEVRVELW